MRHAEIAGAGFAGLTAAVALRQTGWSVRVHERSAEFRAFGAGIAMWSNGIRVLERIGAFEYLRDRSLANPAYETRRDGVTVSKEVFGDDVRLRNMTREDLYRAIYNVAERLGVDLVPSSEVIGAEVSGQLHLASGQVLEADLVVGADGVGSAVRGSLPFKVERSGFGEGMERLLVPRLKDRLGSGEWDNVIDSWRVTGRFLRVLYAPCNDSDLYLALGARRDDPLGYPLEPLDLPVWIGAFPDLAPVLEAAAEATGYYHPYETSRVEPWVLGRVALIGDAAHAMCPALGQGAGTALGDAFTLASMLEREGSIPEVLREWEGTVRVIADRCQALSERLQRNHLLSAGSQFTPEALETARWDPTCVF